MQQCAAEFLPKKAGSAVLSHTSKVEIQLCHIHANQQPGSQSLPECLFLFFCKSSLENVFSNSQIVFFKGSPTPFVFAKASQSDLLSGPPPIRTKTSHFLYLEPLGGGFVFFSSLPCSITQTKLLETNKERRIKPADDVPLLQVKGRL